MVDEVPPFGALQHLTNARPKSLCTAPIRNVEPAADEASKLTIPIERQTEIQKAPIDAFMPPQAELDTGRFPRRKGRVELLNGPLGVFRMHPCEPSEAELVFRELIRETPGPWRKLHAI